MKQWIGFNMLWMFSRGRIDTEGKPLINIEKRELDFIAKYGFTFIRLPLDYRFWVRDFQYFKVDEAMLEQVDRCVEAVVSRGLHCSLNLHRVPGYCINGNHLEKHNLWLDTEAQDAFVYQWELFARRYQSYSPDELSFDLLNEPPNIGQYGLSRENHKALMERTVAAIRAIDSDRPLILDGLGGGNIAMPELTHLGVIHSGRGYQPMALTHYQASWWEDSKNLPYPAYPGTEYEGRRWTKETLYVHYAPWREVEAQGVPVHIGEFGCYNKINNEVALRWFRDILSVFREFGWGYALWNFRGDFGIVDHGRPGTRWETIDGFRVDRELFELIKP
mgnify:FL=1